MHVANDLNNMVPLPLSELPAGEAAIYRNREVHTGRRRERDE